MGVGPSPQTVTLAKIAGANSSTTLFAAATGRVSMRMIYNDSTAILYVALDGSTASTSNYSVQIAPQGYFEVPGPGDVPGGAVTGIWASANGNAYLTSW